MKWTVGTKIGTGFGAALAIFSGIGAASYYSTTKLMDNADWVARTHVVIEHFDGILQAVTDAETGQRGYIITSDEIYLKPYQSGTSAVASLLKDVTQLTRDDPAQQRRLDNLGEALNRRQASLAEGISLLKSKGPEAAHQWVLTNQGQKDMDALRVALGELKGAEQTLLKERSAEALASSGNAIRIIVGGTMAAFAIVAVAGFLITRNISSRVRAVTVLARRIADGDLTGDDMITRSQDEVGELVTAFSSMRGGLRDMSTQVRAATENVNSTAAEILAATQQQAAATKEQAAAIQQITSTLEEITQSGGQIGERAKRVSATVETASATTQRGMKATQETSQTIEAVRDQVEEVAENVVSLSERTQTIGEIIATVSDISEQSNLLALNASIEAVSAGEQGGRFLVVAHEMKNLADRAKDCTGQVRSILSEIQRGINTSVMLTEEAVKRADGGKAQAQATEITIRDVIGTNQESIEAFQQIVAGTNQQQIGVTQVTQGMQDMRQSVSQTAASISQLEKSAANMNALSQQLHRAVERYKV